MSDICCLPANKVSITVDDFKYRGVVANTAFKEGDVIISNEPVAQTLLTRQIRDRCSYCFCKNEQLLQCSKCAFVRYCSRECQKNDWSQHRPECKSLTATRHMNPSLVQDICLLVRVFHILKQQPIDEQCIRADSIRCGVSHLTAMSKEANQALNQDDDLVANAVQKLVKTESIESIKEMQQRFRCNNFGILDDLMFCIGAGVFPAIALLNHSCRPNCILRYRIRRNHCVTLQVVACRSITIGEELTHSYVDLVQPTTMRQTKLRDVYGFVCQCERCCASSQSNKKKTINSDSSSSSSSSGDSKVNYFPVKFVEEGSYRHILVQGDSGPGDGVDGSTSYCKLDTETALLAHKSDDVNEDELKAALRIASQLLTRANYSTAAPEEEASLSERAVTTLSKVCGPFHLELYQARGQLMSAYLLTGAYEKAAEQCFFVVGFLHALLRDVPSHPLLGLQLYTLGDILGATYGELGLSVSHVRSVYNRSKHILTRAYGSDHEVIGRLVNSIRELE